MRAVTVWGLYAVPIRFALAISCLYLLLPIHFTYLKTVLFAYHRTLCTYGLPPIYCLSGDNRSNIEVV